MKNIKLLIALTLLLTSCTKSDEILDEPIANNARTFVASIEENQTRVHIDGLSIYWDDDDRISILDGTNNVEYAYSCQNEENKFSPITQMSLNAGDVYAVYPYNESNSVDANGVITLTFPQTQSYAENSFGQGANTMVAQSSGNKLSFRNVGTYLKLKLWGEGVNVKSITFAGNNDEQLSGAANVTFGDDGIPTYKWVSSQSSDNKTITLDCPDEGVELSTNSGEPTYFWLVVPPQTFSGGFTITVTDIEGKEYVKSTTNSITLERNWIQPMAALKVETKQPADEVWCEDEEGEIIIEEISGTSFDYKTFLPVKLKEGTMEPDASDSETLENLTTRMSIKSISIPEGVTELGMGALAYCTSLEEVVLPSTLETIDMAAFAACQSLESVVLPESVETIGQMAFYGCVNLQTVTLSEGITTIGQSAFAGCPNLSKIAPEGDTSGQALVIPSTVTTIGGWAFDETNLSGPLTIPGTVSEIGNYAFSQTNFTEIVIESTTNIGEGLFNGCVNLTSVTLPNELATIPQALFLNCSALEAVNLGDTKVTSIGLMSFSNCANLKSVNFPSTLKVIGNSAFGQTGLTSITLPDGLERIGHGAFSDTAISNVTIPNSVTGTLEYTFANCEKLTSVTFEGGSQLVEIGNGAFRGCPLLTSITIPARVEEIGEYAFEGCANLANVAFESGINLRSVWTYAFANCTSLTSIILPASLGNTNPTIDSQFKESYDAANTDSYGGIGTPVIEYGTGLGSYVFNGCIALKTVYSLSVVPPILREQAIPYGNDVIVYVPNNEALEAYKKADKWSYMSERIQVTPEP